MPNESSASNAYSDPSRATAADSAAKSTIVTAAGVVAVLRKTHFGDASWAVLEQVAAGTGYTSNRHLDLVAMGCWPSRGIELHGVEVKVSRNDWRRELKDPSKAEELGKFCRCFWIAAPVGVVPIDELPPAWGLLEVGGKKPCVVAKKAEKREVPQPTWLLVASLLRNAAEAHAKEMRGHVALGEVDRLVAEKLGQRTKSEASAIVTLELQEERRRIESEGRRYARAAGLVESFEEAAGVSLDGPEIYEHLRAMKAARAFGIARSIEAYGRSHVSLREVHTKLGEAISSVDAAIAMAKEVPDVSGR